MRITIKQKRKTYFVTEAIKIIEQEGIGKLTARKVAEAAGFIPSSIYNYFANMDHLENTASIYFTYDYANQLSKVVENIDCGLEIYISMWEIFMHHAFANPHIFYNVFYSKIAQTDSHNLFQEYYELFPEQYPQGKGFIIGMLEVDKTQNRGKFVLNKCVTQGIIKEEFSDYINDIHIGYTKHIISDIVKDNLYSPSPQLYHQVIRYIIYSMIHFVDTPYQKYLTDRLQCHSVNTSKYCY